jgi:hypothetical protein
MIKGSICHISRNTAIAFLLPKHYSGRKPQISYAFGWFDSPTNALVAVCTFGKPVSPTLCSGICGKEYAKNVYELNRLCRIDEWIYPLSQFVSACLRKLRPYNLIIVAYSDTAMNHFGYIYQASNFMYLGCTKERVEFYTKEGKHSRHGNKNSGFRQIRSAKHRYISFCTLDKKLKQKWQAALKYKQEQYPKGDSKYYELGTILKQKRNH